MSFTSELIHLDFVRNREIWNDDIVVKWGKPHLFASWVFNNSIPILTSTINSSVGNSLVTQFFNGIINAKACICSYSFLLVYRRKKINFQVHLLIPVID